MRVETFFSSDPRFSLCMAIRFTVFVDEQGVPPEEELDATDHIATHFLVLDEADKALATARLFAEDPAARVGRIGRMAVLREARGSGVGRFLMEAMVAAADHQQFARVILDAQVQAIPFYERCGFTVCGPEHLDCGIPHRMMGRERAPWKG